METFRIILPFALDPPKFILKTKINQHKDFFIFLLHPKNLKYFTIN